MAVIKGTFEGVLLADKFFGLYLQGADPSGSDLWIDDEILGEFTGKRIIITVEVIREPSPADDPGGLL